MVEERVVVSSFFMMMLWLDADYCRERSVLKTISLTPDSSLMFSDRRESASGEL
jgi:hypothetical protein